MRNTWIILLLTGLVFGCSHARSVSRQADEPDRPDGPTEGAADRDEAGRRKAGSDREQRRPSREAAVPLASSPASLLRPGAIAALQDKLIDRGYLERGDRSEKLDGKTEKALRSFQGDQGLPATGMPDDLTVEKLGVSPGDVFRSDKKQ